MPPAQLLRLIAELLQGRPVLGIHALLIGHGGGWSSLYAHLLEASVSAGESLRAGQPLGLVGQSGNASGPHLHLELRQRQPQGLVAVDPTPLLPAPPSAGPIAGDLRP